MWILWIWDEKSHGACGEKELQKLATSFPLPHKSHTYMRNIRSGPRAHSLWASRLHGLPWFLLDWACGCCWANLLGRAFGLVSSPSCADPLDRASWWGPTLKSSRWASVGPPTEIWAMGCTFFSVVQLARPWVGPSRRGGGLGDSGRPPTGTSPPWTVSDTSSLSSRINPKTHNSLLLMLPWADCLSSPKSFSVLMASVTPRSSLY